MRSTKILYPLHIETEDREFEQHKNNWKFIQKYLNDLKEGDDITFDQLLLNLKITEENYLSAIRSMLKVPIIFLRRQPNELRINNYNSASLSACRTNKHGYSICS